MSESNVPMRSAEPPAVAAFDVSTSTRVWMLLSNWVPLLHMVLVGLAVWAGAQVSIAVAPVAGLVVLYILPAIVVRLVLACCPIAPGKHALDSGSFRVWWLTAQCQVIFNRLPLLEELLRLVPCVYSMWLRLWGAKVGGMVFWSPGSVVLDRSFIRVGRGCVLGIGARLHPHLIVRGEGDAASVELWLAPVNIGSQSLIGGFSLLAPGVRVEPGSVTPAIQALPAFSKWQSGRRTRGVRPTVV